MKWYKNNNIHACDFNTCPTQFQIIVYGNFDSVIGNEFHVN